MKTKPLILEFSSTNLIVRKGSAILLNRPLVRPPVKPLVKWPGGKQWLAGAAPYLIPLGWSGRYYEPFVGGGALFFALQPRRATLSDCNRELITAYRAIRQNPEAVIHLLSQYPYRKDFYYEIRSRSPHSPYGIAARLLYLNRTCWNGLYRVNKEGRFNTPFGRFKNPTICDEERIRKCTRALSRASLCVGDFDQVSKARAGDFVYFDPPYITSYRHNGFLKYNAPLFSWSDQERLARLAIELAEADIYVLVSNANQRALVKFYSGFNYYQVARRSLIAASAKHRGMITEALLSSYPLLGLESEVI